MFTAAAAVAFSAAVSAIVSAGTAIAAIVSAAVGFSVNVAVKKSFAFSAGKDFFRFFIKTQTGRSIPALFINTMVANKVAVRNFLSAFAENGYAVRNKVVAFSAVFTSAFMFHKVNPFQKIKS